MNHTPVSVIVKPRPLDRAVAERYLTALFHELPPGWLCLGSQRADGRWETGYARNVREALVLLAGWGDRSLYVRQAVYGERSGEKTHATATRVLYVDYDGPPEAFRERLAAADWLPAPSLVVHTGGGVHAYWFLDGVVNLQDPAALDLYERVLGGLQWALYADAAATDAGRQLRIPGSWNHLTPQKIARGRAPAPCDVVEDHSGRRYKLTEFPAPSRARRSKATGPAPKWASWGGTEEDDLDEPLQKLLAEHPLLRRYFDRVVVEEADESAHDYALVQQAIHYGCSDEEAAQILTVSRASVNDGKDKHERPDYIARTVLTAREKDNTDRAEIVAMFDIEAPSAGEPSPEQRGARRLLTLQEFLEATKPAPPIVDGFLYGSGVFVLLGKWGLGKTYLALDLAQHVAHGMTDWHGRTLHLAGSVVYLALEGEYALPNRIRAWHQHHDRELEAANLWLFAGSMNLTQPETRMNALRMLAAARPALVFVDTLSAAMAGADENAAGAVGEVLEWSRGVVRETSAPVVLLHHPGKKDPNSARGSSTIEANTDGVLQLSRPQADVTGMLLKAQKIRSSAPGHPLLLGLQPVALPDGGSDAVVALASVGDERGRRLHALAEAVRAAGGRIGAKAAAESVSAASTEPLSSESAARWIRSNLGKELDPFFLLAREESGDIVSVPDAEQEG